jgi:hypothetical protein
MALRSAGPSNAASSDLLVTKGNSATAINHLFGPDGIILGVTYSQVDRGLTNSHSSSNNINYQEKLDSKSSCTIM